MTEERQERFRQTALRRQFDAAVVLENISDMHNIGAVMRTCDAVGIPKLYILNTEEKLKHKNLILGKRTTSGSRKWIEVEYFTSRESCFEQLKNKYAHIFATHLDTDSKSIYETDFTESFALVFGNEKDGVTRETLAHTTGNLRIPMMGMVQSLNISVACAVSLYEMLRQRSNSGQYDMVESPSAEHQQLFEKYLSLHQNQTYNRKVNPSD